LQRISEHPASRVAELTPRLWKEHFAAALCAQTRGFPDALSDLLSPIFRYDSIL